MPGSVLLCPRVSVFTVFQLGREVRVRVITI